MKTLLVALTTLVASFGALASTAQVNFSSTVASYCTIGQTTPGIMHVSGTNVTTDSPAELAVNNNEGGIYKVGVTNPGDFNTKPTGFTGVAALLSSYQLAGANATGAVAPGVETNLANSGSDVMSVSINGTVDTTTVAGNYTAVAVASCIAQ